MSLKPASFPPPVRPGEFVGTRIDPPDLAVDVGVLVVGGGPAGLAAAVRAGQILSEHPVLAERLGETAVCVLEKGKSPGSHALSGAVVNPRALRQLFPGLPPEDMPVVGRVEHEAVYYLTRSRALRIPPPPTMRNAGNYVLSLSRLSRWLAERAEELGVVIVPETAAVTLLVEGGRAVGVRTGDRGRGRDGEELSNFEPGADILARATILAEGVTGHLTRAASERFALEGASPQTFALGVKELWRVPRPLRRIIHTLGWPLSGKRSRREFGGSFIYPMGEDLISIGLVVGLDYADASLSVHDLLQELKLHPFVRGLLDGGTRLAWGAKTIPEGGYQALPGSLAFPGGLVVGDGAGLVNVPALKGVHYAMHSGILAAETVLEAIAGGSTAWTPGALAGYDSAVRQSFIGSDLWRVRNLRPAFRNGLLAGALLAGVATLSGGRVPGRSLRVEADSESDVSLSAAGRTHEKPDGVLTFDKLSSVYASGNASRDDAPDHIRIQRQVPRELAETWVSMCPAGVYEITGGASGAAGTVGVAVTASNCVQCGAITAKGGRLTPAEGGNGPDYGLM